MRVGAGNGALVGALIGANVGAELGNMVGADVGGTLGMLVGAGDGCGVGAGNGIADGDGARSSRLEISQNASYFAEPPLSISKVAPSSRVRTVSPGPALKYSAPTLSVPPLPMRTVVVSCPSRWKPITASICSEAVSSACRDGIQFPGEVALPSATRGFHTLPEPHSTPSAPGHADGGSVVGVGVG